jgi:hypothetical protein
LETPGNPGPPAADECATLPAAKLDGTKVSSIISKATMEAPSLAEFLAKFGFFTLNHRIKVNAKV